MSRLLLPLIVVVALGALVGFVLQNESGYVLVNYRSWIIETSVLGALAAIVALILIVVYGMRLLGGLIQLPGVIRDFSASRRSKRARETFVDGLQKWLEGRWKQAETQLVRHASDSDAPALNYLLAASAAQRAGSPERGEKYLDEATRQGDPAAFAAQQLRAELQIERGDPDSAIAELRELQLKEPKHSRIANLYARALVKDKRWAELRGYLDSPASRGTLSDDEHLEYRVASVSALLEEAIGDARLDTLKSVWSTTKPDVRGVLAVRSLYLGGLTRLGADADAAALIESILKTEWNPELVHTYAGLNGVEPVNQLSAVEQWLKQHGETPELLLAAGRICVRNQLWGKARSYLDASLKAQPSAEGYLALGKLSEETKNPDDAAKYYRRGLELLSG